MPEIPTSGTSFAAILFTDLVGSTELLSQLGDARAQAIFQQHYESLERTIRAGGGSIEQWMGDGLMASFASVEQALVCAIGIQSRPPEESPGRALEVRIGLHAGDTLRQDIGSGHFGKTVVVAARLCALAHGREILCSDAVVQGATRGGSVAHAFGFRRVGRRRLKGIAQPVLVHQVVYDRISSPLNREVDSPPPPVAGLTGRDEPLARLRDAWLEAGAGRGRVVLLQGRAGIGTTQLLDAFAAELRAQGVTVLSGRSESDEAAPPYWLWVEVLRGVAASSELSDMLDELGPEGDEVRLILPELNAGRAERAASWGGEQGRFLLFDAVTRLILSEAERRPLAIALEDLHWAPPGSLRLLEHLVYEMRGRPLLIAAAVRTEPRAMEHPLSRSLGLVGGLDHVEAISLGPLTREDLAIVARQALGRALPAELVDALFERTGGIPLFLREALRTMVAGGETPVSEAGLRRSLETLPARASDLLSAQLSRLSPETRDLLRSAAVLGREFRIQRLGSLTGTDRDALLERMDEAARCGVVEESRAGFFRFFHAVLHEAIYAELPPGRRARLHWAAGELLAKRSLPQDRDEISELAHHFHRGLTAGNADQAHHVALAAADQACRSMAWEHAAEHYRQALAAAEAEDPRVPERVLETLLALGDSYRRCADRKARRETFRRARELARSLGNWREEALAALGFCDLTDWAAPDAEILAMLDSTLARVPAEPSALRTGLLTRMAYMARRERARAEPLARAAIELARSSGDAAVLHEALYSLHYSLMGATDLDERTRCVQEMCDLSERGCLPDLSVVGRLDLASDRLTQGRYGDALAERDAAARLAGHRPHRALVWHLERSRLDSR